MPATIWRLTAEGRTSEGRTAEGRTAEGRTAGGRTTEGRTAKGQAAAAVIRYTAVIRYIRAIAAAVGRVVATVDRAAVAAGVATGGLKVVTT